MTDSIDLQKKLADIRANVQGTIIDNGFQVKAKDGREVYFSNGDTQTLFKMGLCPVAIQLNILNISNYELHCHLEGYRKQIISQAVDLLTRRWVDRECGEDFIFHSCCVSSVDMHRAELIKALKVRKCKLSNEQIENVIQFFISDRSEVKEKE